MSEKPTTIDPDLFERLFVYYFGQAIYDLFMRDLEENGIPDIQSKISPVWRYRSAGGRYER